MKQHNKLLLGFVLGVTLGLFGYYNLPQSSFPFMKFITEVFSFIGAFWLRVIFMVVVPLLTTALMMGVYELGAGRGLGKVAGRSMTFTLLLSSLAVLISVGLTNLLKPGVGSNFDLSKLAENASVISIQKNVAAAANKPWYQYFVDLVPQNPIDSAARAFGGEIIALMVFALIFGYALSLVIKEEDHPMLKILNAVFEASLKVIAGAMKMAPYAIFSLIFNTTYRLGAGFLANVAAFAGVVVLGLLIQQFVVYGTCLRIFARMSPLEFFKQCKEVYVYAFSTASSNATLPVALDCAENVLKLPPRISRFVLTIGASANQNGTALFEGVVVLFLAQVYGIQLSIESQFLVVLMSVLAGVGTAGVPGGSLPLIVILLNQVGIPPEGIGLILGVDRFLDMCRTTLNVSGDLVIAKLVSSTVTVSDEEMDAEEAARS